MDRSSQGSRLLGFHRAHGITDSRASAPRGPGSSPAAPPRHQVHGARLRRHADDHDAKWALPLALIVVGMLLLGSIIFAPPGQLPTAPVDSAAVEVSR